MAIPLIVTSAEYLAMIQANGVNVNATGLALLTMFVPMIQQRIEKTIGYKFLQKTYKEWYPSTITNYGGGGNTFGGGGTWDVTQSGLAVLQRGQFYRRPLGLNNLPVRSIIEVRESLNAWDGGPDGVTIPYFPNTSILPSNNYYADFERATPDQVHQHHQGIALDSARSSAYTAPIVYDHG